MQAMAKRGCSGTRGEPIWDRGGNYPRATQREMAFGSLFLVKLQGSSATC